MSDRAARGRARGFAAITDALFASTKKARDDNFGVEPIAAHRHPTVHNLSPVKGDPHSAEIDTMEADEHRRKADWHKRRLPRLARADEDRPDKFVRGPGKLAKMGQHLYKAELKDMD